MLINFKKKNRVLLENKNICTLNFANNGRTFFNTVQKYCCFTHIYFNFFFITIVNIHIILQNYYIISCIQKIFQLV